jgi:hypothetical protein
MNSIAIDERLKEMLRTSIDEIVGAKYGLRVRDALRLDIITRLAPQIDGSIYCLETLIPVLEENFGSHTEPLLRAVGERLFSNLQLKLSDRTQSDLRCYVDNAREALVEREQHRDSAL